METKKEALKDMFLPEEGRDEAVWKLRYTRDICERLKQSLSDASSTRNLCQETQCMTCKNLGVVEMKKYS